MSRMMQSTTDRTSEQADLREAPGSTSRASLETVKQEFENFAEQEALPVFCLPCEEIMSRCNRQDLIRMAKSWGGIQDLSELLGYRVASGLCTCLVLGSSC